MKISGFTIVRNAIKFNYPVIESIKSILSICDEFIVNVGYSEDDTLKMIEQINDPKIRIIQTDWDHPKIDDVLSYQTNVALSECKGDWAFYVQGDEVIHEKDLLKLKRLMERYLDDASVDVFRFRWFHFYGSYFRYRVDRGWFQKQDRIVRNNGEIESCVDAWKFQRKDNKHLQIKQTGCFVYHYGWVQTSECMTQRRVNAEKLYEMPELKDEERKIDYEFGDLNRFPPYFGSHPKVMEEKVKNHVLSQQDLKDIAKRFWWNPFRALRVRYKTSKRIKEKIV